VFVFEAELRIRDYIKIINNWVDSFKENFFKDFREDRKETDRPI